MIDQQDILNDLNSLQSSNKNLDAISQEEFEEQDPNQPYPLKQQDQKNNIQQQKYSRLLTVNRTKFLTHMEKINKIIDTKISEENINVDLKEKQETKEQIDRCNNYALEIMKQVTAISKFIKKIYSKKLPQLESIINNDGKYCRALVDIEEGRVSNSQVQDNNQQGMKKKEAFHYLNPQQRISLRISISAPRDPLPKEEHEEVMKAASIVIQLSEHHETLMIYLETCMQIVAPNLCQLVGSVIASKLIATAGGVDKLAAMPACNIQVMGGSRAAQVGLSQMQRNHTGVFGQMDVVRDAPKKFQMKLVRMLATNTAKCARADYLGTSTDTGIKLREDMYERFQKVQEEGGLARIDRPMEIPDMQPKKKRGGKRHRKNKELYDMSEMRKHQNRIKFGQAEEEINEGVGLGMLKAGIGKLNVKIKKQNLKSSKKMEQRMNKKSGLESTLNLGAHQGIQLINPDLKNQKNAQQRGNQSYFSRQAGFRTVLNSKFGK